MSTRTATRIETFGCVSVLPPDAHTRAAYPSLTATCLICV